VAFLNHTERKAYDYFDNVD